MYNKMVVLVFLMLQAAISFSQQKYELTSDTLRNIELPATVIKEMKHVSVAELATKKIDRKTIARLNQGQDIPYLVNSISSVVANSDAGTGTGYTGIRIRGADITRINVTMNGVPLNDAESQATFFVNTPDLLSSTQQLEVSKGVGISKSGVGNFGAGIAINNLDINYQQPLILYQSDFGSFNTFKNTLKASTGLLDNKFVATIRLSSIKSDGYIQRSTSALYAAQFTTKYELDANTHVVFNYLKGKEKTGQAWNGVPQDSLQTNRTYNQLGIKGDGTFYENQIDNYGQNYYQLFFDRRLNRNWAIGTLLFYTKGKGCYEEYKLNQAYMDYGLADYQPTPDTVITSTDLIRQLWLDNNFYGGKIYATYVSKKLDAGFYINVNQYKGKHFGEVIWAERGIAIPHRWYNLDATKSEGNIYSMVDFKPTNYISIFADMQLRRVHYALNGFRKNPTMTHDLRYTFFNPKLKATLQNLNHFATILVGVAQKEPNRDDIEAGANFIPKPEKLFNTELTYIYQNSGGMSFCTNLFGMFYKDQLVLTGKINDVGAYTRSNIDNSYRIGIEFEYKYIAKNRILELNGNISISQNKILHFPEFIDDYDKGVQVVKIYRQTDISFSPNLVAGGRVSFFPIRNQVNSRFHNLSFDLLPKYVSKQFLDNTSNDARSIKSYFVTDVAVNCPVKLQKSSVLNLRLGIYNVFNRRYEANGYSFSYVVNQQLTTENYYYPQSGIRWMLGAGIVL